MLAGFQIGLAQGAALACGAQRYALQQPGVQLRKAVLGLAPGDLAITVAVQVKDQVKVTQVDISAQGQLLRGHAEREVAVAAGVRPQVACEKQAPKHHASHGRMAQCWQTAGVWPARIHERGPDQRGCALSCWISGPKYGSV